MREKWGYSGQNFNHTGMHLKIEKNIPPFKMAKKYINAINMAVPLTIFYGIYHIG